MSMRITATVLLAISTAAAPPLWASPASVPAPSGIEMENVPPVPEALKRALQPYGTVPGFDFGGWLGGRREVLVRAGAEPSGQVFSVVTPGAPPFQLTNISGRALGVVPRPGRNQFAMLYDVNGDERIQIALFDTPTGRVGRLTDGRSRNGSPLWSPDGRTLAFTSDARNGRDFDLYLIEPTHPDAETTSRLLATQKGLTTVEDWSPDGRRLAVLNIDPMRGISVVVVDVASGETEVVVPSDKTAGVHSPSDPRWSADGQSLFMTLYDGGEFRRLVRFDIGSKQIRPLMEDLKADVESFTLSDDGQRIAVTVHDNGYSALRVLDARTGQVLSAPRLPDGQISDLSFRADAAEIGFSLETPVEPPHVYSYIIPTDTIVRWTRGLPGGPAYEPPPVPERFRYRSFDGRTIPAYIYRPDPAHFPAPRPVLIDLHGGPQAQARPGFLGPESYLIHELGLALVVPNVRGSSGYGLTFMRLDDRRRREDAVKDVGALLDWIAGRPDLDASRVAVRGGSYGGYLVLASLARYSDRIRAGIDVAGISNFETFMADQPPLRLDLLRLEFGDERNPETRAFLRSISPVSHADRIAAPLLVAQGANDPRVPVEEARQIVNVVRSNGVPVWYVLAHNEGHGFSRGENREYLRYVEALFLVAHLQEKRSNR